MKINPDINPEDYAKELRETGTVTIENFLTEEAVNLLHKYYSQEIPPENWWACSQPTGFSKDANTRNIPENANRIAEEKQRAVNAFIRGDFGFHFYRTNENHKPECDCVECKLRDWMYSPEVLGFFEKTTGVKYSSYKSLFASKYSEGCFLSPHTDQWRGDLGFTLQLTKNWWPQWGGLLHFLDESEKHMGVNEMVLKIASKQPRTVSETRVPKFNAITLFYLPEQTGRWHYVSHVNPGVKASRIAYTGWVMK